MRLDEVARSKLPDNVEEIKDTLKLLKIGKYKIHPDGTVDVTGDIILHSSKMPIPMREIKKMPIKLGLARRDFDFINFAEIQTLEDFPTKIGRDFKLRHSTFITSFEGFPKEIIGSCIIENVVNVLSLKGLSETKFGRFLEMGKLHKITSLEGLPEDFGNAYFRMYHLPKLTSLKGMPKKMSGLLYIDGLPSLKSLDYLPEEITNGHIVLRNTSARNLLKILKIKGLKSFIFHDDEDRDSSKVAGIMTKYLGGSGDMIECQEELIEAGFKEYARLK